MAVPTPMILDLASRKGRHLEWSGAADALWISSMQREGKTEGEYQQLEANAQAAWMLAMRVAGDAG